MTAPAEGDHAGQERGTVRHGEADEARRSAPRDGGLGRRAPGRPRRPGRPAARTTTTIGAEGSWSTSRANAVARVLGS